MFNPSEEKVNVGSDASIAEVHTPRNCSMTTDGADLLIHRRWSIFGGIKSLIGGLIGLAATVWFYNGSGAQHIFATNLLSKDALAIAVVCVGLFIAGVYFVVRGVYQLVDSTTIRVSPTSVSTLHHPLPWRTREFPSNEITQVFVTMRRTDGQIGSVPIGESVRSDYSVDLLMSGGKRETLLTHLPRVDQAHFIEAQIEQRLGIKDMRVKGEFKIWR